MINFSAIEIQVMDLCLEVGEYINLEQSTFDRSKIEFKTGLNNMVSYVDKMAEKKLVSVLKKIIPGSGFIAEEGMRSDSQNGYVWIIDPLDGTTNFVHGLPIYAISIALAYNDKIVLGIVFEINAKEMFHSFTGSPAYCNNKEIRVSAISSLGESLLATGFPYQESKKNVAYFRTINQFLKVSNGIRRLGSAATDLAYVACGRFEGFFEYQLNSWDVAAGAFLVQQAGGVVTDFQGKDNFLFGREICASGKIHEEMIKIIQMEWSQDSKQLLG